jgi:peroxiredoxin
MQRLLKMCGVFLALVLLLQAAVPGMAPGEEEASFTPLIPGIKLLAEGDPAPVFKISDVNGEEYDFAMHQKKNPHLIVFFSIFCEPCIEEMPIIEEVYHEYRDQGLEVLAISIDGPPFKTAVQKNLIEKDGYSFRFLIDEMGEEDFLAADPYHVPGTPVLYLVDGDGKIVTGHLGRITAKDLKALIDGMLQKG